MEEYDGAQARFYDRYFVGVEGDVEFYLDRARESGGAVLELGCGTGRTLLPLVREGIDAVGLEKSPTMLARMQRKVEDLPASMQQKIELVRGDMRDFALDRRFGLVAAPYRAFQHLLTPVDQEQALNCIHQHLEVDGLLVLDLFDPLRDMVENPFYQDSPLRRDTDFIDAETGNLVVVWYSRCYDPQVQLMEQELVYEEVDAKGSVVRRDRGRLTLRYTFRGEMEYLLELCGFQVEALYGDFFGGTFPGYGQQVWVARRS